MPDKTAVAENNLTPVSGSHIACYLCGSTEKLPSESLTGRDLRKLWGELGTKLSDGALGLIYEDVEVVLFSCRQCGFRYFDPSLCGSGQFYSELGSRQYYATDRPEFLRMGTFLRQRTGGRILDVGCGDGAFLDRAAAAGWRTYGSELNTAAAGQARAKGHQVWSANVAELIDSSREEPFDVVTAFQLLEHVQDPIAVLTDCRKLVRPGGVVAVAVPYDRGIYRAVRLDPHQWPPHHLSRWRRCDLRRLGKLSGLEEDMICVDVLYGSAIDYFLNLERRFRRALNRPVGLLCCSQVPALISFVYSKTGMKHFLPGLGQSAFARFRRRD
jgi:SAM-dependent methyltransferase